MDKESGVDATVLVRAKYAFRGKNNDEVGLGGYFVVWPKNLYFQLCFHKSDIITITQKLDGGWWEGTLGEKTGWFPKNYVTEVSDGGMPRSPSL